MAIKKKKPYNGRDLLYVEILKGVTKAGVQKDRKKEESKKACRKPKKLLEEKE